ncbi:hypothetical protein DPEC_G00169110 [Dallia pectoralis]|uniref:Uncharacterized protein n=1 Tax=Dallia pectoralis TaxID=75939 RepID=A0ACC2GCJ7_DALPE|nr:hypothetical protein DPEC_G00169110 [Dallia pectoralis]
MSSLCSDKETLIDEIEKSLFTLTEDNLRSLCKGHGLENRDGSQMNEMNHRLLRRKIMEEMWDNVESMTSDERGMSWLLNLKKDIRIIQDNATASSKGPGQTDDDDDDGTDKEDSNWLPSNGLGTAHLSLSQSDDEDDDDEDNTADCDEDWDVRDMDRLPCNGLEAEPAPESPVPEKKVGPSHLISVLPKSPGRTSRATAVLRGQKMKTVQLVDRRRTGQTGVARHNVAQSESRLESHTCNHCGKIFTTMRSLKRHLQYLQRCQDPERSHVCPKCGKGFPLPGSLKRHLRTHTGEKPYVCQHCGKEYNDSGNLQRHIKTHSEDILNLFKRNTGAPKTVLFPDCKDGSEIEAMNHRLLRRKIMKEMWEKTDPMKPEEQGMSWLLKLKEDIRKILEDGTSSPRSPCKAGDHGDYASQQSHLSPRNRLTSDPEENDKPLAPTSDLLTSQGYISSASMFPLGEKPFQCHECNKAFAQLSSLKKHQETHRCTQPVSVPNSFLLHNQPLPYSYPPQSSW